MTRSMLFQAGDLLTAFQMANSGKFPVMTIFWLKTRCGWKETKAHELGGGDKLVGFTLNLGAAGRIVTGEEPGRADAE